MGDHLLGIKNVKSRDAPEKKLSGGGLQGSPVVELAVLEAVLSGEGLKVPGFGVEPGEAVGGPDPKEAAMVFKEANHLVVGEPVGFRETAEGSLFRGIEGNAPRQGGDPYPPRGVLQEIAGIFGIPDEAPGARIINNEFLTGADPEVAVTVLTDPVDLDLLPQFSETGELPGHRIIQVHP